MPGSTYCHRIFNCIWSEVDFILINLLKFQNIAWFYKFQEYNFQKTNDLFYRNTCRAIVNSVLCIGVNSSYYILHLSYLLTFDYTFAQHHFNNCLMTFYFTLNIDFMNTMCLKVVVIYVRLSVTFSDHIFSYLFSSPFYLHLSTLF